MPSRVLEGGLEGIGLVVRIEEKLGFGPLDPNSFEIHLVTLEEALQHSKYLRIVGDMLLFFDES